jgi:hypothetical protein
MKHKLMIKTHNQSGLKYLCYTRKENYKSYTGSGIDWINHLLIYGFDFSTELIYENENFEEFKKIAIQKSLEFDIVNSDKWANRKIEEGDGGDTVSNKKWITNGDLDKYINKDAILPDGWRYGRSNCVFNDPKKQKEFNSRVDKQKRGISIKKCWDEGRFNRDHSRCGIKGDKNPSKRIEVKEKIRKCQLNKKSVLCEKCQKWYKNIEVHKTRSKFHCD